MSDGKCADAMLRADLLTLRSMNQEAPEESFGFTSSRNPGPDGRGVPRVPRGLTASHPSIKVRRPTPSPSHPGMLWETPPAGWEMSMSSFADFVLAHVAGETGAV